MENSKNKNSKFQRGTQIPKIKIPKQIPKIKIKIPKAKFSLLTTHYFLERRATPPRWDMSPFLGCTAFCFLLSAFALPLMLYDLCLTPYAY